MDRSLLRRNHGLFESDSKKSRRPAGVSRRRKKQLGFEMLEDRRVMSATAHSASLYSAMQQDFAAQMTSLSSNTPEGAAAIMARELYWQELIAASTAVTNSAMVTNSLPSDPLFGNQWHLVNTGQSVGNPDFQAIYGTPGEDINVAPVWNMGLTGNGVVVAVIDSGVQLNHPDLAANIDVSRARDFIDQLGDGGPRFDPLDRGTAHGTAVAGLIGAVADNGIGGSGVAPGVTLVPIRLIDAGQTDLGFTNAFRYTIDAGIDITNNSWGPGVVRGLAGPTGQQLLALRDSIIYGRDGLGVIHIFASGNDGGAPAAQGFQGAGNWDTSAYNGWVNSRYTITVGGVDHDGYYNNIDGTVTSYPESGPNVLVAAPTGSNPLLIGQDTGIGSGLYTTDLTGDNGFNYAPVGQFNNEIDRDFLADTDYTSRFNGTSAATPLVSGVVALMLEANPNLSWRDVKEILVRSARTNGQFDIPNNGFGQGLPFAQSQNLWIINQMPLFRDPDPFGTVGDPFTETFDPTLTPEPPQQYTNGAGYTVSQGYGVYGEQLGYGHGVVDAELAVKMAQQWHLKGQNLPSELTWTTFPSLPGGFFNPIPSAERAGEDASFQVIPGGLGGDGGFAAFWDEYFVDDPFSSDDPPTNTRGIGYAPVVVPDSNAMSVETVEVKISLGGGTIQALDHLRITLVSPSGAHSDLNKWFYDAATPIPNLVQTLVPGSEVDPLPGTIGTVDTQGGNLIWSFTTNRHWGERSDGEWQVHFENYDFGTSFQLDGLEVTFHGSPLATGTERLMGFVGVDENRDDVFHFANDAGRGDAAVQEKFAPNTTVNIRRTSDNSLVDQFVVGHDGNFYFDVAPGDYTITVEDPLGRAAQDDSLNGASPEYLAVWQVTAASFTGVTGATNAGFNFLLDPGDPPAPQATFHGTIYADTNGDGEFNSVDVALPGAQVYGDVNRNGFRDAGEVVVTTDANGQYNLVVPNITAATALNVGVIRPVNWTSTNDGPGTSDSPTDGLESFFVQAGSSLSGVDFYMKPPAVNNAGGGGASQPGYLLGFVFEDVNGDGVRQSTEAGLPGFTVYLDNNNSGAVDAGDVEVTTNQFGAYAFGNVAPGQRILRVEAFSPFVQTLPGNNAARVNTLVGSSTISGISFGIQNTAILDFGDLPSQYHATLSNDTTFSALGGARHRKGPYILGSRIDAELNGFETGNADGDDLNGGLDDEDGIEFVTPLSPGTTAMIKATAVRNGGYLQAWADWNNDNDFDDVGERIITNRLLYSDASQNFVTFAVPAGANAQVYLRFRYGEFATAGKNINTPFGFANSGEVEDYFRSVPAQPAVIVGTPGDFDQNGAVDGLDFLNWQRNMGRTSAASQSVGNANGDTIVDGADLAKWKQDFGKTAHANVVIETGDFDGDADADGADFLALQRNFGMTSGAFISNGDGNGDRRVDGNDIAAWSDAFGQKGISAASSFSAVATASGGASESSVVVAVATDEATASLPDAYDFTPGVAQRNTPVHRSWFAATLADATASTPTADYEFLRRDRALDDLFAARRRPAMRAELNSGEGDGAAECDEAFALLADHFERPLG